MQVTLRLSANARSRMLSINNDVTFLFNKDGTRPAASVCRDHVVEAVRQSWYAYERYAWGSDELMPLSRKGMNWYGKSLGMMIIDNLDTLYMAGLHHELDRAVEWVATEFSIDAVPDRVSFFEVTIRVLGGLVSGYELTNRTVLLDKAIELGNRLLEFGMTSGRGFPRPYVPLHQTWTEWFLQKLPWLRSKLDANDSIAIVVGGSVQLEFRRLSQISGNRTFDSVVTGLMRGIERHCVDGLCSMAWSNLGVPMVWGGVAAPVAGLGAHGDSFYEYLLKQFLLTKKKDTMYKDMWLRAAERIMQNSRIHNGLFIPNFLHSQGIFDHLSCFSGGLFALSYATFGIESHLATAKSIALTCHAMTQRFPSGLPPELIHLYSNPFYGDDFSYRLRPEILETYFYLWRVTKEEVYRDWAWQLFASIYRHLYIPSTGAFAGAADVRTERADSPLPLADRMETFWLTETMKYMLLMFDDKYESAFGDDWVLSTEAHPFRTFNIPAGDEPAQHT